MGRSARKSSWRDADLFVNQEAMDGFARVNAGVTSPADFLSEENAARIIAAAEARQ